MDLEFGGRRWAFGWWRGERLVGTAERPIGFDLETAAMAPAWEPAVGEDVREIPPHPLSVPPAALGMAFDGKSLVLIHPSMLDDFVRVHAYSPVVGHNVAFDFHVLLRHGKGLTRSLLWEMGARNRIADTMLLDQLIQLAKGEYRHVGKMKAGDDAKIFPANLGVLCEEYGVGELSKEDVHRLRFGELLGKSEAEIEAHPEWREFAEYALKDVIGTYFVFERQRPEAIRWMERAGWSPKRKPTYEVRPDALEKFGPLSLFTQVRGAIAFAELSRTPLLVDEARREALERATRDRYAKWVGILMDEEPGMFQRYKPKTKWVAGADGKKQRVPVEEWGQVKVNKRTGLPRICQGPLRSRLLRIAAEIGIEPPISKGKEKGLSLSADDWSPWAEKSPFLEAYCSLTFELKLLSFFQTLRSPDGRVYSRYDLLKRTGRTSAAQYKTKKGILLPSCNIQQLPRPDEKHPERDVRNLFVAPPGWKWVSVDYRFVELAVVASICKARFGYSNLGEVIRKNIREGGPDPHQVTAAAAAGLSITDFLALDKSEQKAKRQSAKALNFGRWGGMGDEKFIWYSKASYGVAFTKRQAADGKRAWQAAYPETKQYLADHLADALAWQTGLPRKSIPKLSWLQGKRYSDYVRGKIALGEDEKEAFFDFVAALTSRAGMQDVAEDAMKRRLTQRVKNLFLYRACSLTGRVRNYCNYSTALNSPFQGTAADGAKECLYEALRRGVRVLTFIHDSIDFLVPAATADRDRKAMEKLMVKSMEDVLGVGIPIGVDSAVGDRWSKS